MNHTQSLNLSDILANRRWVRYSAPFPFVYAQDVFIEEIYCELEAAYQSILERGYGQPTETDRFSRNINGYDAYSLQLMPGLTGPFRLFVSKPFHDMLATLMNVEATGDVNAALHHHDIGSANGQVHNDFNPGWFAEVHEPDSINILDRGRWSYMDGRSYGEELDTRETVRAVAMLFFLNNPAWLPGDGGETGLYRSQWDPVEQYAAAVPPLNNSMLVFECTPYSYHSFLSNRRHPRNSVILWLHRSYEEAVRRWGEAALVRWPQG